MTKTLPRASFNSSRLIRLLTELASCNAADSKQAKSSFAERLGQWLGFTDAIALSAALNGAATRGLGASSPAASNGESVDDLFLRVRGGLMAALRAEGAGKVRVRLPAAPVDPSAAVDFTPYRRYCIAHQRDMEAEISQLRGELRSALTRHSPPLAQLAALDAAFDKGLGERERHLLAKVPVLLERRFDQLQHAALHSPTLIPGLWLATFCAEMQAVLLAELEYRLQPAQGLLDTLNKACRDAAAAATIA